MYIGKVGNFLIIGIMLEKKEVELFRKEGWWFQVSRKDEYYLVFVVLIKSDEGKLNYERGYIQFQIIYHVMPVWSHLNLCFLVNLIL